MNTIDVIFIVDNSGSMHGLEKDTLGGFNSVLQQQKQLDTDDQVFITTLLFNNRYHYLHKRTPLEKVSPLTEKEYQTGGGTALLDAMGDGISKLKQQIDLAEQTQGEHRVLCVVITDGYENSSREYTNFQIKNLVENRQNKDKWEFLFLGANIDAFSAARSIGITANSTMQYAATSEGLKEAWEKANSILSKTRSYNFFIERYRSQL